MFTREEMIKNFLMFCVGMSSAVSVIETSVELNNSEYSKMKNEEKFIVKVGSAMFGMISTPIYLPYKIFSASVNFVNHYKVRANATVKKEL